MIPGEKWQTNYRIALNQSGLSKEEQEEVYDLLVKNREVFSLRDKNGTCPNIEVDLEVIDKSPCFITFSG